MKQMSFAMTTEACRAKVKTVTRRRGWWNVKLGELLQQIEKGQGLKKGEKVRKIHVIRVASARPERADEILRYPDAQAEVVREGLPELTPAEFVQRLCKGNAIKPAHTIMRIAFEYVEEGASR